ncbi:hypothetical protein [Tomitella biformata]|uniref:hypothetical protein n=1 Tax=Tomitella biformata TaxID=630403 RepID=UPI000462F79C|nr:hypothetical protein [Tomitella biformata]
MTANSNKTEAINEDPLEGEEILPPEEVTIIQAQRVVASFAEDADECRMLFSMLGIGPTTPDE